MSVSTTLLICSLRGAVSQAMFCRCGSVLDTARAVEVTIEIDGAIQFCKPFCGPCADRNEDLFSAEGVAKKMAIADVSRVNVEKIDGRTFTKAQLAVANAMYGA